MEKSIRKKLYGFLEKELEYVEEVKKERGIFGCNPVRIVGMLERRGSRKWWVHYALAVVPPRKGRPQVGWGSLELESFRPGEQEEKAEVWEFRGGFPLPDPEDEAGWESGLSYGAYLTVCRQIALRGVVAEESNPVEAARWLYARLILFWEEEVDFSSVLNNQLVVGFRIYAKEATPQKFDGYIVAELVKIGEEGKPEKSNAVVFLKRMKRSK